MVNNGYHPVDVKKGIEYAGKILLDFLDVTKRKIRKKEEIYNLAMITTNKDKIISKIITEALMKTGSNGFLNIEESPTGLTELLVNFFIIKDT
jgi:chaperonin GroEL (HSP60 family)